MKNGNKKHSKTIDNGNINKGKNNNERQNEGKTSKGKFNKSKNNKGINCIKGHKTGNTEEYNSTVKGEQLKYWLGLSLVPGLGPIYLKKALEIESNPEKLWLGSVERLRHIFGQRLADKISEIRNDIDLEQKMAELDRKNIKVISFTDPGYPGILLEIADPPPILFYRGSIHPGKPAVAIVGSRKATGYGIRTTRMLAQELASRGIVIVSGLALGIDRAAHEGALDVEGESWAVLGSGLDYQYPSENLDLYHRLPKQGAIISEFPPEIEPQPGNFPRRNRIISGLCQGVVVVEAARKSGSLITASLALDQNRHVLAVPGNIDRIYSQGTNNLIKEGAMLVTSAEDIISYLYQLYRVEGKSLKENPGNSSSQRNQNNQSNQSNQGNQCNQNKQSNQSKQKDSDKRNAANLPNAAGLSKIEPGPDNSQSTTPHKKTGPASASISTTGVIIPPDLTPAEKKILNIFTREVELTTSELQELTDVGAVGINVALINLEVAGVIGKGEGEKYYFKGLQNLLEPI